MITPVKHFYCHIPFCPSKCGYCAFVTHIGSLALVPRYLEALEREFEHLAALRPGGSLETVYFGGGTPSMLAPAEIARLVGALDSIFGLDSRAEITLEAHPDTVGAGRLAGYRDAGVTRLSMGAESMVESELHHLGRSHAPGCIADVVRWAREAGFESVALDLMYGLPEQTVDSWLSSLEAAIEIAPDHLSLYPLSIEPRTVFARRRREGRLAVPADESVAGMYQAACELLSRSDFEHYEIANWARPGHACRHNLAYWQNREFYGAGVGAHGYLHPRRYENIRQTRRYTDAVLAGDDPVSEVEVIDADTSRSEFLMLGLRLLRQGVDRALLEDVRASGPPRRQEETIERLISAGLLTIADNRILLPERVALVAHEVISELM